MLKTSRTSLARPLAVEIAPIAFIFHGACVIANFRLDASDLRKLKMSEREYSMSRHQRILPLPYATYDGVARSTISTIDQSEILVRFIRVKFSG